MKLTDDVYLVGGGDYGFAAGDLVYVDPVQPGIQRREGGPVRGALPDAGWSFGHPAMLQPYLPAIAT